MMMEVNKSVIASTNKLVTFYTGMLLLCLQSAGAGNLAATAKITASSQLNDKYPPGNVTDGVISDASRWLSEDTAEVKTLTITFASDREIGGYILYNGWENEATVSDFYVQKKTGDKWEIIPSGRITANKLQKVEIHFDEDVKTSGLRFVFENAGIIRIREIVVWAPGDEPGDGPSSTVNRESPAANTENPMIFVNQSGYNLNTPKRFTAIGFSKGSSFQLQARDGKVAYRGVLQEQVGDFSEFNPKTDQEFLIKINESFSDYFRIGPWWLERVTTQNAVDFMIQARQHVGNVTKPSRGSFSWRDDHHFAYSLQ